MTPDDVRSVLEALNPLVLPPSIKGASVRYRFDLENAEGWDILLSRGLLRLADQEAEPDCVIQCAPETFVGILSGRINLLTALVRGELRIRGEIAKVKLLYTFLRYARPMEAKA
jgi:putative sterol carrier protein